MNGNRAGRYVNQPEGYRAFIPQPLPPEPGLDWDKEMIRLYGIAKQKLGELNGATRKLPDPDLFVLMYMRHEAVRSSQIEETHSTIQQMLLFETGDPQVDRKRDTEEVVNYVEALRYGLQRVNEIPLSLRLIKEIHEKLLKGVRGQHKNPGRFADQQRQVGSTGFHPENAEYIPPPPDEMRNALSDFEEYLRKGDEESEPLIKCGLIHAQFETIHPFMDGNGRMGRMLIVLLLCLEGLLDEPVLYISHYINQHKPTYYERLQNVRDHGDWEGWITFFLKAIKTTADKAARTTDAIFSLQERDREKIGEHIQSKYRYELHDYLFRQPIVTMPEVANTLDCSYQTARDLVLQLEDLDILHEYTGQQRYRKYVYLDYYDKFEELSLNENES